MAGQWDKSPNKAEIADQLHRMLESDIFVARPQQAKVFQFVVMSALANEEVTEKTIRAQCFPSPPYEPYSTIVRTTVNSIRDELLPRYYAAKSEHDLVIITIPARSRNQTTSGKGMRLPAGQAYKPVFHYNPDHGDIDAYRFALHCIRTKYPSIVQIGAQALEDVVRKQRHLASAYIAAAEASCLIATWARELRLSFFSVTERNADKGQQLNPKNWHAACAYALCCMFNYNSAFASAALHLGGLWDWNRTRNHFAFQMYLFLSGRTDDAIALMQIKAENEFDNAYLYALLALFLYMNREFEAAREQAEAALAFDLNCWLAHLILALVRLCSDDASQAYASLLQVQRSCGGTSTEEFIFPGVVAVAAMVARELTPKQRTSLLDRLLQYDKMAYTQLSLCFMVTDRPKEAIKALESAIIRHEPATLFLPFLPIFDPLRKEEGFQTILDCLPTFAPLHRGVEQKESEMGSSQPIT